MDKRRWKQVGVVCLATGGYTGYFPIAPGTFGTLVGVALVWWWQSLPLWTYLLFTIALGAAAVWVSGEAGRYFKKQDSSRIVIDEVVGFLITMIAIPVNLYWLVFGFILFRIFDVIKLPPANYFDSRMKNGLGVVLDDVAAGIYGNIILHLMMRANL